MLDHIWGKIRERFMSTPKFMARTARYSSYQIGDWSYGEPTLLSWGEGATLNIGRFCSIAPKVIIMLGGEHRVDWVTTYPFNKIFAEAKGFTGHPRTKGDVIIGNDVWIGYDALILSGVSIANGAVVAARSVVVEDVAPYSIVAGNPARHIRFRFAESTIAALEQIAWWDWPLPKIMEALPSLLSSDIEQFIATYLRNQR
jgi:virginiamycin A acetyltransferase